MRTFRKVKLAERVFGDPKETSHQPLQLPPNGVFLQSRKVLVWGFYRCIFGSEVKRKGDAEGHFC